MMHELHPYVQTLALADLDSCVSLEEAAFPIEERASREKVRAHFCLGKKGGRCSVKEIQKV